MKTEKVIQFEYLVVTISNKADEDMEVGKIPKGSKATEVPNKIRTFKLSSTRKKVKIYKMVIQSSMMENGVIWMLYKGNEQRLKRWKRKIYRETKENNCEEE